MNDKEFNDALPKLTGFAKGHAARIPSDAVIDKEDMVQEALEAVWRGRHIYDAEGTASFSSFAYKGLRWGALTGKKRGDWRKQDQKDTGRVQVELFEETVDAPARDDESLREILLSMDIVNLNPKEKRAVTLYLAGFRVSEIARLMEVHETTVWFYIEVGSKKILGIHWPKARGKKPGQPPKDKRPKLRRDSAGTMCLACAKVEVKRNDKGWIPAYCDECEVKRDSYEGLGGHKK